MTVVESDGSKPWWASGQEIATTPRPTDVGAICGHVRFLHDENGKCTIDHRVVHGGGNEGGYKNKQNGLTEDNAVIPQTTYVRDECFCPGETTWYRAGLPSDGSWEWDSMTETIWRDPEARRTKNGEYIWWLTPKKPKNKE
jgi:hypothetical protein